MTDLHVEGTPGEAAATFLNICRGLSESARLISRAELGALSAVELTELRQAVAVAARSGNDDLVDWCWRTDKVIVAEFYLRAYTQAAIDAKAAVIIDEERRLACGVR